MSVFGERVRVRRETLEMSQESLKCILSYKSSASINRIERGKADVSVSRLADFAKALETSEAYLLGLVDNPKPSWLSDTLSLLTDDDSVMNMSGIGTASFGLWLSENSHLTQPECEEIVTQTLNLIKSSIPDPLEFLKAFNASSVIIKKAALAVLNSNLQ